jgi:hypothetical protein
MILHFSHIGLTEGRTFTLASLSSSYLLAVPANPALEAVSAAATGAGGRCAAQTLRYGRTASW